MYVSDNFNIRIRKLTVSTGIISTIAGTGTASFSGDSGDATSATFKNPIGVALDTSDNVYIADTGNHRVRKITVATGKVTTIAGSGSSTFSGDGGSATSAALYNPNSVALDSSGNVYIADTSNNRIRKVTTTTGKISTIAGSSTSASYSGDNGAATSATLNYPAFVALDSTGNVYIADSNNNRIRVVTISTGIISTIAGSSTSGSYSGDGGYATSATFSSVQGVTVDAAGNIYVVDYSNCRVRKVTIETSIISTYAGTGTCSYSGDGGPSISAGMTPRGIALDASGNAYITDLGSHRIRKVIQSTGRPSVQPTYIPSSSSPASAVPSTSAPSVYPSLRPTPVPSLGPTSSFPTIIPTARPSTMTPSMMPSTRSPSVYPSVSPSKCPSIEPSFRPSFLPSTATPSDTPSMVPSFNPTAVPTTYPTYVSGVHVYFMVTQLLSGVSASTYFTSKEVNDKVFMRTIVSMIGYDSKMDDVTIQSVADVSVESSRSLSAAAAAANELTLIYSINTATFIFNDTNYAVKTFVNALNDSIVTGDFDALLRANGASEGVTDLQAVTTIHVEFSVSPPTVSPTSMPTSSPTSSPTKLDLLVVNPFSTQWTNTVAKEKIDYYLGTFVGYFVTIYVCFYLYSLLQYGKITATKLYDSSYQSEAYVQHSAVILDSEMTSYPVILADLYVKNEFILGTRKLEDDLKSIKSAKVAKNDVIKETLPSGASNMYDISISATFDSIFTIDGGDKYSKGYREYVQQQRTMLGCRPLLFPDGYVLRIPFLRPIIFPPGRVEDILLFLCHNHPLFSCFYFMDGSKLGAHGTRILYIGKDVSVFVLYQFSNMVLQYLMLYGIGLGTFINLFVITPSAVSIGLLLKYLYTCPFTETVEFQRKYANYQSIVLFLGRLAILPIMIIMFGSLIVACLFSNGRHVPIIIIDYFVYVQFYGILLAIANSLLLFVDNYYYKVTVYGLLDIVCIGNLYKERIIAEQLVVDVDYAYRIYSYLFGVIVVQKILSREDSIKAKWIVGNTGEGGIEMEGAAESPYVITNPLAAKALSHRKTAILSIDAIYGSSNEGDGGYIVDADDSALDDPFTATENPIHCSFATTENNHSNIQKSVHLPQLAMNDFNVESTVVDEDDDSLYREYQSLYHNQSDEAAYEMDMNSDAISFEEWKKDRVHFKQGTRSSFVQAFQAFEEREQLARHNLEQSASVKNTMHLHSTKIKNVLAATKAFGVTTNTNPK